MKRLLTLLFLSYLISTNLATAQLWDDWCPEADVEVRFIDMTGPDVIFEIWVRQSSTSACGTINLGNADFILDYNVAAFTSPTFSKEEELPVTSNPFGVQTGYFRPLPTSTAVFSQISAKQAYYNNTAIDLLNNQMVININGPTPTAQSAFDDGVSIITPAFENLGRFKITGYDGTSSLGFAFAFSPFVGGGALNTQIFAVENGDPNPMNGPFESVAVLINSASVILDLELTNFDADKHNETSAIVNWETAFEKDLDKFVVQRSTDAVTWTEVGEIKATGNSLSPIGYNHVDADIYRVGSGKASFYYRLKSIDLDGTFEYSNVDVVVFNSGLNSESVSLLPNPAHSQFVIALNQSTTNLEDMLYQITDVSGRIVGEGRMTGEQTKVNVERLAAGVYVVSFTKNGVPTFDSQRMVVARP